MAQSGGSSRLGSSAFPVVPFCGGSATAAATTGTEDEDALLDDGALLWGFGGEDEVSLPLTMAVVVVVVELPSGGIYLIPPAIALSGPELDDSICTCP